VTGASNGSGPKESSVPLLRVDGLVKHFPLTRGVVLSRGRGAVHAVDGLSFEIPRGGTLGLVGESGSGKSTVARLVTRLLEPTAGEIVYDGTPITHASARALRPLRREIQLVFQDPYSSLNPRRTVGAIVAEPLRLQRIGTRAERRARVRELLEVVGLNPEHYNRYPHEFSGGQRQRIGIARALVTTPKLVVADEPVSALDVSIQAQILNLLGELQGEFGLTYLFVAHDLSVVKHISDRVAVMYLGKIVEVGPPDQLYASPGHPYTRALLSAVPVPDPNAERKRKRVILKGDVPSPVNPPPGCRFHTRCWLYERLGQPEDCRTIDPPLAVLEGEHRVACHHSDEARKTDVGIAHIDDRPVRHGTPEKALESLKAAGIDPDAPPAVLEAPEAEALDATLLTSTNPLEEFQPPSED